MPMRSPTTALPIAACSPTRISMRDWIRLAVNLPWTMATVGGTWMGRMLGPPRMPALGLPTRGSPVPGNLQSRLPRTALAATLFGTSSGSVDMSRMVVLGEGLAAGMASFSLSSTSQKMSFAARVAAQAGVGFSQRLIQPPGIGNAPGFPRLPVRIPGAMQTTVLESFPDNEDPTDLSVPGFSVSDALEFRPKAPLVWRDDARQTAANLILGLGQLMEGAPETPTQLECALARRPT